ncbi:hypothetical protein CPB84DRAFT_1749502 [Gymnopilus junonius]|uniref:Uncharacterized protein n=1 Tax=Gymnopilus junonius TaxID=109634 RepID=A0A9P5NJ48_GYMJU|nr:hypothetical protein CPB84DRAFT_1749502 [Gymnopilus junonius]
MMDQLSGHDSGRSVDVDPGGVTIFFQVCEEIRVMTSTISRTLKEHHLDVELAASISRTSEYIWNKVQDILPRFLPLVSEVVYEYQMIFSEISIRSRCTVNILAAKDLNEILTGDGGKIAIVIRQQCGSLSE